MTPDLNNEENSRIKSIVHELCNQLAINREQTKLLKKQLNGLKNRPEEYNGPLYRPSRGPQLPPLDAGADIEQQLIYENQSLNEENASLRAMLKEYEQSLKTIMVKFRYQAYEIQQSKLEMQRNYEILLEEQRTTTTQVLSENALLQSHLLNLGSLVREAYDAQSDLETDILVESLIIENQGLRQMLKIADEIGSPTSLSGKNIVREEEKKTTGQEDDTKNIITNPTEINDNQVSESNEEEKTEES